MRGLLANMVCGAEKQTMTVGMLGTCATTKNLLVKDVIVFDVVQLQKSKKLR
jgi:hypothetical protein